MRSVAVETAGKVVRRDRGLNRRGLWVSFALAAFLATLVTTTLLAVSQQSARNSAQTPHTPDGPTATFLWYDGHSQYHDRPMTTRLLEARHASTPPPPPGLERFPAIGTAYVSPALREAIRDDPELAKRIPGKIVGIINPTGLTQPDALMSIVGSGKFDPAFQGDGWGSNLSDDWSQIPVTPARLAIGAVGILPCLMLTTTAAWACAAGFRQHCASLALVGASQSVLRRFIGAASIRLAFLPTILGLLVGSLTAHWLGPSGFLGMAYFPLSFTEALGVAFVVGLLQCSAIRILGSHGGRNGARASYETRRGANRDRGGAAVLVGGLGFAALAGVLLQRWTTHSGMAATAWEMGIFLLGSGFSVVGGSMGAPAIIRNLSGRVGSDSRISWLLGWRQLAFDSKGVVMQTITLATLASVFLLGSAVNVIIADADVSDSQARVLDASLSDADSASVEYAVHAMGRGAILVRNGEKSSEVWASCEDLARVYGSVRDNSGNECRSDRRYAAGDLTSISMVDGIPSRDEYGQIERQAIGPYAGTPTSVDTRDPYVLSMAQSEPFGSDKANYDLIGTVNNIDDMETAILHVAPTADFTPLSGSVEQRLLVPMAQKLILANTALGLFAIVVGLLLTSWSFSFGALAAQRYSWLGARRRQLRRLAAVRMAISSMFATAMALVISGIVSQTYLSLATVYHVNVSAFFLLLALLCAAAMVSVGIAGLTGASKTRLS